MLNYSINLDTLADTQKLARAIYPVLATPMIITLNGNLGAGKTTLTREIIYAYGVKGNVKSPTFTLLEEYNLGDLSILHFDLYRFSSPDEWIDLGFDELLQPEHNFIALIEWAEKALDLLPPIDWQINLQTTTDNRRLLTINPGTRLGEQCLQKLIKIDVK